MNKKKDILSIVGLLATTSLAVVSGGLVNPAAVNIIGGIGGNVGASLVAHFLTGFTPAKIKRLFVDVHPNDLNHSIKKLFIASIRESLNNISVLFSETQASDKEKTEAKQLIKILQKRLPDVLLNSNQIRLDEPEIKRFLYEKGKEDVICNFVENQFDSFGITEPFKSFLAQNLPVQLQLCFGEGLKDPANQNAWVAFQRMLMEEIRSDIKNIADTQQSIKDDLSDLKFEKSGFSESQIAEVRQLVQILNDKKLVEVKITNSVNHTLESIENRANEVIRITTKTQLTVDELKNIVEKLKRQNHANQFIIYTLAVCLMIAAAFVAYKLIHQPFTTTLQVYGWENEQHNPLNGTGGLVLTLGDKTERSEINRQGEAVFKGIMPQYNGKTVAVQIIDTENEPYYLTDSIVKITKNEVTKVQVLLYGLDMFEGRIVEIAGENKVGIAGATVYVDDISATTDERGHFAISIPQNKQKREQYVEISKDGYITYTNNTMPMVRKRTDSGCEIILTRTNDK